MDGKTMFMGAGPLLGMLLVQLIATGLQILSKLIFKNGAFVFAIMTYRHLLAAICIAPFAFYFERKSGIKLTMIIVFWIFLTALFGITMAMGLFYYGLKDTTATYATNFLNLIPIVTFIFSIITRMEKLKLKTERGKVRIIGTMFCLAGALIISLYKGHLIVSGHHPTLRSSTNSKTNGPSDWTRGSIFLVGSVLSYAAWFIIQVKLLKALPFKYWATMLTCLTGAIQTAIVGICIDRRMSSWKIGWDLNLLTIVYSGALASAASFCLISWAVSSRGPTFPAMFNPLCLIFVAVIEVSLLGEDLRLGSLLGMLFIIVGLYAFLWGSSKGKKSESPLPKSTQGGGEAAKSNEIVRSQLSATIVPTASPSSFGPQGSELDDEQHL